MGTVVGGVVGGVVDSDLTCVAMPGIRETWAAAAASGELRGCGLHGDWTLDDIMMVQESLRERLVLAGVEKTEPCTHASASGNKSQAHQGNVSGAMGRFITEEYRAGKENVAAKLALVDELS